MAEPARPRRPRDGAARPRSSFAKWSKPFLSELAATSNVSAAARKAGVSTGTAYDTRRANPEFNRQWQQALSEGYDHLEMELLHRLRNGEVKPASGAKRGVRAFDNATAFRLLPALAEDREKLWSQIGAATFLSDAEKRAMLALPPQDGGNK